MSKVCVITGATSGIGLETAKGLAHKGYELILIGRNQEKGDRLLQLLEGTPAKACHFFKVDLSLQKEIRTAGDTIRNRFPKIDVLINNAAVWNSNHQLTNEGVEEQWAVNHLSYFLMTHILYESLVRSERGRVICVGSDSHKHGMIHFDDVNLSQKYHGLRAYAQSKLANVLFAGELHRRKSDDALSTYCVQPGLVKTDIGLKNTKFLHGFVWKLRRSGGISSSEGAKTSVFLASDDEAGKMSGQYWDNCKTKPPAPQGQDQDVAAKLWELSEKMCGIDDFFSHPSYTL